MADKHSHAGHAIKARSLCNPKHLPLSREVSRFAQSKATANPRHLLSDTITPPDSPLLSRAPVSPEPQRSGHDDPPSGFFTFEDIVNSPYRRSRTRVRLQSQSSISFSSEINTPTSSPRLSTGPTSPASPAVWPVDYDEPPEGAFTIEDIINAPYRRHRRSRDDAWAKGTATLSCLGSPLLRASPLSSSGGSSPVSTSGNDADTSASFRILLSSAEPSF